MSAESRCEVQQQCIPGETDRGEAHAGTLRERSLSDGQSGCKSLSVTIKDGICYVNFDSTFLTGAYDVLPEVTVYSIVNSLVGGTEAQKVQITINGENRCKVYGESGSVPASWGKRRTDRSRRRIKINEKAAALYGMRPFCGGTGDKGVFFGAGAEASALESALIQNMLQPGSRWKARCLRLKKNQK